MKQIRYFILIGLASCSQLNENSSIETTDQNGLPSIYFEKKGVGPTGIEFSNTITEYDSLNFFNFEYIYNGGGVAIGDINNDGYEDIYFVGNQVEDKLYLNKGNLQFEDITSSAIGDLGREGWHTGVVMQDINQDGWIDIFVSRSGPESFGDLRANLCLINNHDLTFSEKSQELGLSNVAPTTQCLFFDLENDGDLDMYEMNHPYNTNNVKNSPKSVGEINDLIERGSPFSDVLYLNESGQFRNITKESGISNHAFGLGIAASDFNNDGYADLYISNDYMAPDYMYINQKDGTFQEDLKNRTSHISNYSMGNDVADFNNDGLLDFISVDMVSADHIRSKKNMGGMSTKKFWETVSVGYHYQYMFNCLQMANGDGSFSDIAQLSGIAKTDWSWAPLFADFDNDGLKDILITNGYKRDSRDNDYQRSRDTVKANSYNDLLELMPSTKISNYLFKNKGDLTFEDVSDEWGLNEKVNSNGAAYADFDLDGDLDLVINHMEDPSCIYENLSQGNNFLQFGTKEIEEGTKVEVSACGISQLIEYRSVRGFASSVSKVLHFGLGDCEDKVVTVKIINHLGQIKTAEISDLNQTIQLKDLKWKKMDAQVDPKPLLVEDFSIDHRHQEYVVNDFEKEVLLPNKMSQLGPFMSKGDVDGNGYEDLYVGGSRGFSGALYLCDGQNYALKDGPWQQQSKREESGSVFFDLDNDGDLDLYICSGSNEYNYDSEFIKDQLYLNNGQGDFTNVSDQLPPMQTSSQVVSAADFDGDGFVDLFVGGRQTPGFYPFAPRSYLLKNNQGVLSDVTVQSKALMGPGMITDAQWIDLDDDNDLDLVVVGEWMAPTFYRNDNGLFIDVSNNYTTSNETGWWNCIDTADFNRDGKVDFVFGNLGLNNKFHPDHGHPLEIYTHDFDKNGTYDIVLAKYQDGTCYPVRGKQCSTEQMPFVSQKFPTYGEFAVADLEKIYGKEELEKALHYSATNMKSSVLLSSEKGYELKKLPNRVQVSPINDVLVIDIDSDGDKDLIAIGNNFAAEVETVRYDAGIGFVLVNDGKGEFSVMNPTESGIIVRKDTKDILMLNNLFLISANSNKISTYKPI